MADRVREALPEARLEVALDHTESGGRRATLRALGPGAPAMDASLRAALRAAGFPAAAVAEVRYHVVLTECAEGILVALDEFKGHVLAPFPGDKLFIAFQYFR